MRAIQLEDKDALLRKIIDFLAQSHQDLCHLLVDDNDLSDIAKLENQELNEIADARLNNDPAFITISLQIVEKP